MIILSLAECTSNVNLRRRGILHQKIRVCSVWLGISPKKMVSPLAVHQSEAVF